MKKIIIAIVGLALIGLATYQLISHKKTSESTVYQYDKEKPITVSVETIKLTELESDGVFTGIFEPNKEVKINAETQGKITSFLVDIGDYVKQGQTIIQLDNSLLKLQLETVNIQIEGLQNDVNRFTILADADAIQGVQLEKATLGLRTALIQKATLEEQIRKSIIKAPFSGIVTAKLSEIGAFAAPGVPLLQITDISKLKFTVNIPEINIEKFRNNQDYLIFVDALPDISLTSESLIIGSKANMGNSFPIQFEIENTPELDIKSGMFGKVKLIENEVNKGILIPSSTITYSDNKTQVYIVKDEKAILQTITIAGNIKDKTIVVQGLSEGDVIVTSGFINLFDNANVNIK